VTQTAAAISAVPESSAERERTMALHPGARGITTSRIDATRRVDRAAKHLWPTAASACFMSAPGRRACLSVQSAKGAAFN
jgi:hypothetical protein